MQVIVRDNNVDQALKVLKLAENKFSELLKSSDTQLNQKKELIDQSILQMKSKLEGLDKSTNELTGHVKSSQKGIGDLADSTQKLSRILSSSQERGQWGERMVEDILSFMGLVEGINFEKQQQIAEGRPDFTFKLPNEKRAIKNGYPGVRTVSTAFSPKNSCLIKELFSEIDFASET